MDNLLTPIEVSDLLGVTIGTLSVWRCKGSYPLPYVKVGRRVMYKATDVRSFIDKRRFFHSDLAVGEV
ncbi:Helix-turn-helix domain-containing protein [Ferrimonas sediminum]|uniref:Helix-turn-helix domain-containing protein n=1 Tax=Ferrimonas sediminum TaxID=718193 RepID=A0A1G8YAV6_9GAMM|nr:helix-turn-helix domain-containing protein [Ferrimonas sediminum]SDJ99856.1 Helix-turn-helix domain-containing protein [Ferrimonas sediminum]